MKVSVKAFAGTVWLAGAATLAIAAATGVPDVRQEQLALAAALVVLGVLAINFPLAGSPKQKVVAVEPVQVAAILLFNPPAALIIIGLAHLLGQVALFGRGRFAPRLRRSLWTVLFNTGQTLVAYGLGAAVYYALAPGRPVRLDSIENLWALPAFGVAVFAANVSLVGAMVALQRSQPVWEVTVAIARRELAQFAALALIGVTAAAIAQRFPWILILMILPTVMVRLALGRSIQLLEQTVAAVEALADVVDKRDPNTFEHSQRVSEWAGRLAREVGLGGQQVETIRLAARVHDVGKVGIPDAILLKQGPLSDAEYEVVKTHVQLGYEILSRFPQYAEGKELVLGHHERFDGGGYPRGIAGDRIPLGAQIICLADCLDAMTSDRPYRNGMELERALVELERGSGTHWNPLIVAALRAILERERRPTPLAQTVTATA